MVPDVATVIAALGVVGAAAVAGFSCGRIWQYKKDRKKIKELKELVKHGITVRWQNHE